MKKLTPFQSILFLAGGLLMVLGAGCFSLMWHQRLFCWVFLAGTVLFTMMQLMQTYEGKKPSVKRLRNIQAFADLLFILSGLLMIDNAYGFLRPMFGNVYDYINLVYNKWVLPLLIAALLEVYTTHRLSSELEKN